MMSTVDAPWDDEFETLLRGVLARQAPDEPILPGLDLAAAGLDSLTVVQLLFDIEEQYGVEILDLDVTPEMVATPGALWQAVHARTSAESPAGGNA